MSTVMNGEQCGPSMEYHPALKWKEILVLGTTLLTLEDVALREARVPGRSAHTRGAPRPEVG